MELKKDGTTAIALSKNMNLLRHRRTCSRWVLIVLESIMFLLMYLPHTWGGEANLEDFYKTLNEIKQKFYMSGIIAGMDAQVKVETTPGTVRWWRQENESRKWVELLRNGKQICKLLHGMGHEAPRQACKTVQ